jgi:transcriptional regulator with XRE-family HTH domain
MARNFRGLQAKMPRRARERSERAAKKMMAEMGLAQLREAMDLTQESLASALNVKQASISKMERRSDMYISTLSKIIEAMGGKLQITANMPNGRVEITQFSRIRKYQLSTVARPTGAE